MNKINSARSYIIPIIILISALALLTQPSALCDETNKNPDSWINLFDGKTLQGWVMFLPDPNSDPLKTWYVKDGILHCSGTPTGYIRTDKKYSNYRLQLEWRWSAQPGNSGVLLHVQDKDEVWPKSIEAQLLHENAGDFWVIGGTDFDEHTNKNDRRVPKRKESSEKKPGEWNQYDIWCEGKILKYM